MQGRVAGLNVTTSSGQPGAPASVRIRGTSSLMGGNEPLYVVDGMPLGQSSQSGGANPLASINPADIVSMEVLKDASATAIYGSRAANGVVIITTRRGKAGEAAKISYDGSFMISQMSKKLDMMNLREYSTYVADPHVAQAYGTTLTSLDPFLKVDPQFLGTGSDWQDALFRTAYGHSHQLSVTGGTAETQYAMSLGYQDQQGIMLSTDFQRFNGRINLENQTKRWLRTGITLAFTSISQTQQPGFGDLNSGGGLDVGTTSDGTILHTALRGLPTHQIYNMDGTFYEQPADSEQGMRTNPIAMASRSPIYSTSNNVMGQVFADAEIIKDLRWRTTFSMDYTGRDESRFFPTTKDNPENRLTGWERNNFYWYVASTLTYYKKFMEKQSVTAMVTAEATESTWRGVSYEKRDFPSELSGKEFHATSMGNPWDIGGYKGSSAMISYLGRLNYNYDERYLLTASGRFDGSSNFAPENRWGFFPSFSVAWRVSQEHFIKESESLNDLISNLRLRAGYGQTGNSGSGIAYLSTFSMYRTYGGSSAILNQWANRDLLWETNFTYNAGLDVGFFKNRIGIVFDAFYKQNDNLIVNANPGISIADTRDWPYTTAPRINLGSVRNTGFEIALNTVNVVQRIGSRTFEWTTDATFSRVRNKIVKLQEEFDRSTYWRTDSRWISKSREGHAPGLFWGFKTDGLIQNEEQLNEVDRMAGTDVGDLNYVDVNNDGKIDVEDMTFIGDPNPKFTGGIGNTFTYGNWSLTIFLTGSYGNEAYNLMRNMLEGQNTMGQNYLNTVKNYARVELDENGQKYIVNSGTNIPRPNNRGETINLNAPCSHFVEDASFLRIQNIALAYRFPRQWTDKISINDLRLTANMQNVYTFTNYSGYNPEVGNSDVLRQGIDTGSYPIPRMYTFSLSFNF
jgi:TonB-linked SusC/RagA family outer membrane protein